MYSISGTCRLGADIHLDIRKYEHYSELVLEEYAFEGSPVLPTVREFHLSLQRWNQLVSNLADIEQTIQEHKNGRDVRLEQHLGGNYYLSIKGGFETVTLRKYRIKEGGTDLRPTRTGITLKFEEFERLASLIPVIERLVPELTTIQPCYMQPDHANLLVALYCSECNPNSAL